MSTSNNSSLAALEGTVKRQVVTFNCCCCGCDFKIDTTDDPDPRPSPLGDVCPTCKDAGKQRPADASGQTLPEIMAAMASCRFCKGNHWAMNCLSKEAAEVLDADPFYKRLREMKADAKKGGSGVTVSGNTRH